VCGSGRIGATCMSVSKDGCRNYLRRQWPGGACCSLFRWRAGTFGAVGQDVVYRFPMKDPDIFPQADGSPRERRRAVTGNRDTFCLSTQPGGKHALEKLHLPDTGKR
jgi:hypothetical protein